MNYVIVILIWVGLIFLAYKYFDFRKRRAQSPGYTRRKAIALLFLGFMTFTGLASIFAEALFEYLGLEKPAQFEWMIFAAYTVFALATALIMRNADGSSERSKSSIDQRHTGSGDNIGHDKVVGDKFGGNKIVAENVTINRSDKKKPPKELTEIVPRRNPNNIQGRTADVKRLRKLLQDDAQVVLVNGLGGIGKTTLAEVYVQQYYESYTHIAWVGMQSESLLSAFARDQILLRHLELDQVTHDALELFREITIGLKALEGGPHLLVLDNATSKLKTYRQYLPGPPNWHVLVTSREDIFGFEKYPLGYLSEEDAIKLFQEHCTHIKDIEGIRQLIKSVEYHTLTIELLAKTATEQNMNLASLKNAIHEDVRSGAEVARNKGEQVQRIYRYLARVFDLAGLSEDEIWLMKQFVCLPDEYMPYDTLRELIDPKTGRHESFSELLNDLVKKGWLQKDDHAVRYKMHRVIFEVCLQKICPEQGEVAQLLHHITQKLQMDQAKDNPIEKFQWASYGLALEKVLVKYASSEVSSLQNNLATVLKALGQFEQAKILLEKATASAEKNFGEHHPTTAIRYSNLALVLQDLGQFEQAKILLEKATASAEKNFGEHHPTTAISYSNLATVLKDLGQFEQAKILLEKATASDEKNFGEHHSTTAISYSNLATVLQDLGQFEQAKILLEKATASAEKNFGEHHSTTAISYSNLATVLKDLGQFEQAKILLEKATASDEKNFGEHHPTTAISYSNLALVLQDLGQFEQAKILLEKATASAEKNFGEHHSTTAISYSNLATVLKALGQFEQAKILLEKATASAEKNFGEHHPTTAIRYSNLALVLQDLGQFEQAKILLEKATASDEKNFGEHHPTTAIRYSNLALVLKDLGQFEQAKILLEKATASAEKNFGEHHPTTAISYSNLALVLQDLGQFEQAKILLEKATASAEKNFGEHHPTTAISYSNLATVLKALGQFEQAKILLEKATASDEKNFGEHHPTTAISYSNLALVLQDLGQFEQAKRYARKAVKVFSGQLPEGHPNTAVAKKILNRLEGTDRTDQA